MNRSRTDIARQSLTITLFSALALSSLFLLRSYYHPFPFETVPAAEMPLARASDGLFVSPFISRLADLMLTLINAVLITRFLTRYSVTVIRVYIAFVFYIIFARSAFWPVPGLSTSTATMFLVLSTGRMVAAFKRSYRFEDVFLSSFYLGLLPMLFAPSIYILAILPIVLIIYRRTIREFVVSIAGVLLPVLLCSVIWWALGYDFGHTVRLLSENLSAMPQTWFPDTVFGAAFPPLLFLILCVLLTLVSTVVNIVMLPKMRTRPHKIYLHTIVLLICTATAGILSGYDLRCIPLFAVPCSILAPSLFIRYDGAGSLIVYLLLIGGAIAINLLPFIG